MDQDGLDAAFADLDLDDFEDIDVENASPEEVTRIIEERTRRILSLVGAQEAEEAETQEEQRTTQRETEHAHTYTPPPPLHHDQGQPSRPSRVSPPDPLPPSSQSPPPLSSPDPHTVPFQLPADAQDLSAQAAALSALLGDGGGEADAALRELLERDPALLSLAMNLNGELETLIRQTQVGEEGDMEHTQTDEREGDPLFFTPRGSVPPIPEVLLHPASSTDSSHAHILRLTSNPNEQEPLPRTRKAQRDRDRERRDPSPPPPLPNRGRPERDPLSAPSSGIPQRNGDAALSSPQARLRFQRTSPRDHTQREREIERESSHHQSPSRRRGRGRGGGRTRREGDRSPPVRGHSNKALTYISPAARQGAKGPGGVELPSTFLSPLQAEPGAVGGEDAGDLGGGKERGRGRSRRLSLDQQKSVDNLSRPKQRQEGPSLSKECSFKPGISGASSRAAPGRKRERDRESVLEASGGGLRLPDESTFLERVERQEQKKQAWLRQQREEKDREEMKECSFAPSRPPRVGTKGGEGVGGPSPLPLALAGGGASVDPERDNLKKSARSPFRPPQIQTQAAPSRRGRGGGEGEGEDSLLDRLTRPLACSNLVFAEEERRKKLEEEANNCTFRPDIRKSQDVVRCSASLVRQEVAGCPSVGAPPHRLGPSGGAPVLGGGGGKGRRLLGGGAVGGSGVLERERERPVSAEGGLEGAIERERDRGLEFTFGGPETSLTLAQSCPSSPQHGKLEREKRGISGSGEGKDKGPVRLYRSLFSKVEEICSKENKNVGEGAKMGGREKELLSNFACPPKPPSSCREGEKEPTAPSEVSGKACQPPRRSQSSSALCTCPVTCGWALRKRQMKSRRQQLEADWLRHCTFHPKVGAVSSDMAAASAYLRQPVYERLARLADARSSHKTRKEDSEENEKAPSAPVPPSWRDFVGSPVVFDRLPWKGQQRWGAVGMREEESSKMGGQRTGKDIDRGRQREKEERAAALYNFLYRQNLHAYVKEARLEQMRRAGEIDPHPEIDPLSAAVAARRLRGEGVGHLPCEERLLLEGRRTELKKKMKEYQQTVADLEGFRPSVNSGRKGMGFEKENEGDEAEADVARGIACALALYDEAWRRKDRMTFLRDLAEEEKMRPFTFKPETNVGKPGAPSGASVLPCADETGPDSTTLYLDRLRRVREIRDRRREAELKSREQREMEECTFRPRVRGAPPFVHRIARSLQVARNAAARKQVYQEHPCSDGFSSYRASQPRFPGTVSPEDLSARRVDWK